jgi:hypothetical protein
MEFRVLLPLFNLRLHACAGHHVSRDDQALDLAGAFINLVNLGVPEQLLHRVFGVKASA